MAISQDNHQLLNRINYLRIAILVVFLGLAFKLWHLTVIDYEYYLTLASRNQLRTVPLTAPRGLIYDRDGQVLVENVSAFNLFLYREEAESLEDTRHFVEVELGLLSEVWDQRLEAARDYSRFQPILLQENLSMETLAYLLAHQAEHPELKIIEQPKRLYRHAGLAAHVLGFVGEVSHAELLSSEFEGLKPGAIVGKTGLERVLNKDLTGRDGYRQTLVTSFGQTLEETHRVLPQEGRTIQLTLDSELQAVAESELDGRPGAVVAFDPGDGEILAMASSPSFDPNLFAGRISMQEWRDLIDDPEHPLQNRAIQNTFSPGSIFKIIIALAGLESGFVDTSTRVFCNGAAVLYGHPFRCWKAGGHGWVRLKEAIQHSCNVYFYQLGKSLGIDRISEFSKSVGLGNPTGIFLTGEVSGLVPSREWKMQVQGQRWYDGETISVSIGQGPLDVTPIQLARAIGIVATGYSPQLHLLKSAHTLPVIEKQLPFKEEHLRAIREAMWSVVNEGGTGRGARVARFDVCGKTGTAQTISRAAYEKLSEEDKERFEPNAWFVGYAPLEKPEIVVAVIVQRGGSGGSGAAPIAGAVFSAYYDKNHSPKGVPEQMASLN